MLHPKVKELQLRAMPVNESRQATDNKLSAEERTIKGYLIVWGVRDSYGTIFLKGCCSKSLQERGPNSSSKYKITGLWQHNQSDPIGQFTVLEEDDYGLYFELLTDEGVPSAERAVIQTRSGTINQFSVGFDYVWDKVEYDDKLDALLLKEIILMEGSAVTIGSNPETFAYRSAEDYTAQIEYLRQETESFIKSLPPARQLEARQLFTRNISLAKAEPEAQKLLALRNNEPTAKGIDYEYLNKNLKLF